MNSEEFGQEIVAGIISAQKIYEQMSGGCWLDDAPEYFLTSQLSLELKKKLPVLCTLEEPMVNFKSGRGAPNYRLRRNGRADIALWSKDEQVAAIVEVKNNVYHNSCESDLHRLSIFARRIAGRPIGAFAYYQTVCGLNAESCRGFSEQATENLRKTIERNVHHNQLQIEHLCFASEPVQYDDDFFYNYLAHASTFQMRA